MALFSRRKPDATSAASPSTGARAGGERAEQDRQAGPWDAAQLPQDEEDRRRIDLGALRVPEVAGMQLRMTMPGKGAEFGTVIVILGGSALELSAFAAPRTAGIWEELCADMCASFTANRIKHQVVDGPHGREILAQQPVRSPDGQESTAPVRVIGIDGPRWFLRGALRGRAAIDDAAAAALREVLAGVVVVRDGQARPPRELLPLHEPGRAPAPETEDLPGFEPLKPGPTIAEVR